MQFVAVNNNSGVTLRIDSVSSQDTSPVGTSVDPSSTFSYTIPDADGDGGSLSLVVDVSPGESVWIEWDTSSGSVATLPNNDTIDPRVSADAFVDADTPTTVRIEVHDAQTVQCTVVIVNQVTEPDGFRLVRRTFGAIASTTLNPPPPDALNPGDTATLTATRLGRPPAGFADYAIESHPHELAHLAWANNAFNVATPANGSAGRTVPGIGITATSNVPDDGSAPTLTATLVVTAGGALDTNHVDVAPGSSTSVAPPMITGIHRVFYAFEERAIKRATNDRKNPRNIDDSDNVDGLAVSSLPLRLVVRFADGQDDLGADLTWTVNAAGADVPSGAVWQAIGAHFKIPLVDPAWADTPLIVTAALPSGERIEAHFEVMISGIEFFTMLVGKLEAAGLNPVQVLDCLRVIGGYSSTFHDNMMGMTTTSHQQPVGLAQGEVDYLHSKLAHGSLPSAWVADLTGESVAIGHLVTGLLASANRDTNSYSLTFHPFDNLWAETLGGDLGQSATMKTKNPKVPLLGPSSGSEFCELVADIDGLLLGDQFGSALSSGSMTFSQILRNYYLSPWVPGTTSNTSAGRYGSFTYPFWKTLLQSTNFAFSFAMPTSVPDSTLKAAVQQFYDWLHTQQSTETDLLTQLQAGVSADTTDTGN